MLVLVIVLIEKIKDLQQQFTHNCALVLLCVSSALDQDLVGAALVDGDGAFYVQTQFIVLVLRFDSVDIHILFIQT